MSSSLLSSNVGTLFQGPFHDIFSCLRRPRYQKSSFVPAEVMTSFEKFYPSPASGQMSDLRKWDKITAFCSWNFRFVIRNDRSPEKRVSRDSGLVAGADDSSQEYL